MIDFVELREKYSYDSKDVEINLECTDKVPEMHVKGIYAKTLVKGSVNLRLFEKTVQNVFLDYSLNLKNNTLSQIHKDNMKEIIRVIVYWKMSSQGGRAKISSKNVMNRWSEKTEEMLMQGYINKDFAPFKIEGVRIPTASAIIRFLYPFEFGIIDTRVVGNYTQGHGITTLKLRDDGYIVDSKINTEKYITEYVKYLKHKATDLNDKNIKYQDINEFGEMFDSEFRACDIEMALFNIEIKRRTNSDYKSNNNEKSQFVGAS